MGRTTRRLWNRIQDHISNIKMSKDTNVAKHFVQVHNSRLQVFRVHIIQLVNRGPIEDHFSLLCKRGVLDIQIGCLHSWVSRLWLGHHLLLWVMTPPPFFLFSDHLWTNVFWSLNVVHVFLYLHPRLFLIINVYI